VGAAAGVVEAVAAVVGAAAVVIDQLGVGVLGGPEHDQPGPGSRALHFLAHPQMAPVALVGAGLDPVE